METQIEELTSTADMLSKLTYNVVIETENEDMVRATVWGLPDCQAEEKTRSEALEKVRELLKARLSKAEIVQMEMEMELPKPEHPWMKFAGMYADNPVFPEVLEHIEADRRELDGEMEAYYRAMDVEEDKK